MKLYRFPYSGYARYVQTAITLCRVPCEVIDVAYGERNELATLTGGSISVPVVVHEDGRVLKESRQILETLVRDDSRFAVLVPAADAAPIWAYADWASNILEDVAFRIASPGLAARLPTPFERALFVFSKERKFGAGCVSQWQKDADLLFGRFSHLLEPTRQTLRHRAFLFGDAPTLADAALYGQLAMLDFGAPDRVAALGPEILGFKARLEERLGDFPYGRIASEHRSTEELDRTLAAQLANPRTGRLDLIVVRTQVHERMCKDVAQVQVGGGIVGDRWAQGAASTCDEVSLMDIRVALAIAQRQDWELFGDNLFVDFDLGNESLKAGDKLRLGSALLEITDEPHHGCRKFSARFGPDALRWVNHKANAHERRRGIFARVVEAGLIRVGDALTPV